ncbi:Phosphoserine phosphatase 1 [Candidatus Entotheonellaceae bacterium PAL068K]
MTRLLLVRHGETAWNAEGRFQGQTEMPLSPRGQRQAAALARMMAAETVQALYASDLSRAWETARRLATSLGCRVQPEPRLREMAFGRWEGLTFAEVQQDDADSLAAWQANPLQVAPPQGETLAQVTDRVSAVLAALVSVWQDGTIVLVAHGGPLRVLLCLTLGLPPQAHWRFMLVPGSVSELHLSEQEAVLMRLNDTHHLPAASCEASSRGRP